MPTTHDLKIWPEFYAQIISGQMTFAMRRNDRGYKIGDLLLLKEFDPLHLTFLGPEVLVEVTSYLDDKDNAVGRRALAPGYCVMSIKKVHPTQKEPTK